MADVHVHTVNNEGYASAILLDDEQHAEMIAYLKGLVNKGDLAKVEVKRPPKPALKTEADK